MGAFRKSLPCVSLLLLAVLVPVQAAGCCKWSALLGWASPADNSDNSVVAAKDLTGGMAADHACCRKQKPENEDPTPATGDCASGEKGCCLRDAGLTGPALASVPGNCRSAIRRWAGCCERNVGPRTKTSS